MLLVLLRWGSLRPPLLCLRVFFYVERSRESLPPISWPPQAALDRSHDLLDQAVSPQRLMQRLLRLRLLQRLLRLLQLVSPLRLLELRLLRLLELRWLRWWLRRWPQ